MSRDARRRSRAPISHRVDRLRRQRRMRLVAAHAAAPAVDLPLCASAGSMPVGSPTMQAERLHAGARDVGDQPAHADAADLLVVAEARSGSANGRSAARNAGTCASARPMKLFMSALPRPYRRPSLHLGAERIDATSPGRPTARCRCGRRRCTPAGLPAPSVANRLALRPLVVEGQRGSRRRGRASSSRTQLDQRRGSIRG